MEVCGRARIWALPAIISLDAAQETLTRTPIMPPRTCALCDDARAILKRPKTGQQICKECFFYVFETEVHNTIQEAQLFKRGDRVAIGASGGKGRLACWERAHEVLSFSA